MALDYQKRSEENNLFVKTVYSLVHGRLIVSSEPLTDQEKIRVQEERRSSTRQKRNLYNCQGSPQNVLDCIISAQDACFCKAGKPYTVCYNCTLICDESTTNQVKSLFAQITITKALVRKCAL